jgi:hypothetical protein
VLWYPTQAKVRLEWGTQLRSLKQKPQVAPLRYAPVGMTVCLGTGLLIAKQICHPDRSEA